MSNLLEIKNLQIKVEGKVIIRDLSLSIGAGEVHALMGPNGSGKSTLAAALAGHPNYEIAGGQALLAGRDVLVLKAEERAQRGLFLAFQYPVAIPGLSVRDFLLSTLNARRTAEKLKPLSASDVEILLNQAGKRLKLNPDFFSRSVNDSFSGGEKKRLEILQLLILKPKVAILDETDSGLDIDALKLVAKTVKEFVGPKTSVLVITHYQRLLYYLKPTHVHVLVNGKIVKSAGEELVDLVERTGYKQLVA
ncbi:MAG: Fe-S cluster assembly ATPase SufC [Patescibacteria group bacterium]